MECRIKCIMSSNDVKKMDDHINKFELEVFDDGLGV
jgi:hypothetical protein